MPGHGAESFAKAPKKSMFRLVSMFENCTRAQRSKFNQRKLYHIFDIPINVENECKIMYMKISGFSFCAFAKDRRREIYYPQKITSQKLTYHCYQC